jgi:hypothetical protein
MDRERGGKWMGCQARQKLPEEGDEGRGLWGEKSQGTGGVGAGGCADNGRCDSSGGSADGGGSEKEHADRAEIPDRSQRAPQAP